MRELLLWAVTLGSLPLAVVQPFIGILVYSWIAYMRPQDLLWIAPPNVSLLVALATLLGVALAVGRERLVTLRPQSTLMMMFAGWVVITSFTAMEPARALPWASLLLKILLISLLTTGIVCTAKRFQLLVMVIAFSIGLLGLKYAVYGVLRGGVRFTEGPGGFMADNNAFAMALNMAIPLLAAIAVTEDRRVVRILAWVMAGSCAISVIFSFSRGGLLTLAVVAGLLFLRTGKPLLFGLVVAGVAVVFILLSTPGFREAYSKRADTMKEVEADSSAMGRIWEWELALKVFVDYPIFGIGLENLSIVRPLYQPRTVEFKVTHNSFLQLLVSTGLPGLALFLSALAVSYRSLGTIRRANSEPWIPRYAMMMQIAIIGFAVGGMLLDMAYFDLIYHLIALTVSLEIVSSAVVRHQSLQSSEEGSEPWWREASAAKASIP